MSVILVVEQDADYAERIHEVLRVEGLSLETHHSSADALRRVDEPASQLLLVSSSLPGAPELLTAFSRGRGGTGAIVLVPASEASGVSAADFRADEMLATPFSDDDLRQLVHRCLQPDAGDANADNSEQLTSADIFGDVLAEVEAEAQRTSRATRPARPERPMEDIERKLEETLSGVIPTARKSKRSAAEGARESPEPGFSEPSDSEIDALLDQTLSSLDIPTRARKTSRPRPAAPAAQATAPEPAPPGKDAAPPPAADVPAAALDGPTLRIERDPPSRVEPEPRFEPPPEAPAEPSISPPDETPAAAVGQAAAGVDSVLDEVMSPEDQFRTQPLPAFDLAKEMAAAGDDAGASEGEPFGDYTLLDRLAIGGMAEVWRARRRGVEGFRKSVAIKKILSHLTGSQDFVTMFIDEAKLAAQLTHNNIIQIYDLGKVGNDFFIAMELVDGKDLRSILTAAQESRQPMPMKLGLFIVGAVARALDYAHRKRDFDNRALGLVHRDVSPQNVLISYEGEIKLCDFGIVKAVAKASTTQMGALKGKLQYMSPEQAWGKTVDARSDIFSLGSVLFEVLTGTQLFAGESEIGVLDAVRECRIRSTRETVPEIPPEVDRIVQRALAKTPEERFQTAGDMEHEITAALDDLGPTTSQKDLATYLHSLFTPSPADAFAPPAGGDPTPAGPVMPASEEVETPVVEPTAAPAVEPVVAPSTDADTDTDTDTGAEAEATAPKKRGLGWLVAAIVIVLIGVGLLVVRSLKKDEPAPVPAVAQPAPEVEEAAPALLDETSPAVPPAEAETATGQEAVEEAAAADPPDAGAEEGVAAEGEPEGESEEEQGEEGGGASGLPATAAGGIDIEQMVNEELSSRAERLRRDFEAEKKRLEAELAKTQAQEALPPPPSDENTDGDEPPPPDDEPPPPDDEPPPPADEPPPPDDEKTGGGEPDGR